MRSERSQKQILKKRKKKSYDITYMWNLKNTKTSKYIKKEADQQIEQTSSYQWVEGRGEEQHRGRGLKGTNY